MHVSSLCFPSSYPCLDRQNQLLQLLQEQDLGKEDERRPPLETVVLVHVFVTEAMVVETLIVDGVVVVGNHAVAVPMTELHCVSNGHGQGGHLENFQTGTGNL